MKKTLFILIIIFIILLGTMLTILGLATGMLNNNDSEEVLYSKDENMLDKYIQYKVYKGSLDISENLDGVINFEEGAVFTIETSDLKETAVWLKGIGEDVLKDQVIYSYGKKEVKSPNDCRIIDINNTKNNVKITLLDYSKTNIMVSIPDKYQNKISINTNILGLYNIDSINLKLKKINPNVENNMFSVILNNPFKLYEKSNLKILIHFEKKENVIIIDKKFIKYDVEKKPYVEVLSDGEKIINKYITLGESNYESYEIMNSEELVGKTIVINKEELMLNENKQ